MKSSDSIFSEENKLPEAELVITMLALKFINYYF